MLLRIFIFDTYDDALDELNFNLSSRGHEVLCYSEPSGCPIYRDGDGHCSHDYPCGDIMLLNNDMPRMSGLEFIRRQTSKGCKGSRLNKAVVAARWTAEELATAAELGCQTFSKPIDLKELNLWLEERQKLLDAARVLMEIPS